MPTDKPKGSVPIQNLLNENTGIFAALQQHANAVRILQEKIKAKLPPPLSDHFIIANIDAKTLTLHTDNSAWAARLRFKTPDILSCVQKLHDQDCPQTIRIKVVPAEIHAAKPKRKLHLSNENAQLIRETANSITDPVLRDALIKLSQHLS
jgi:hypothetical protein